MTFAVKARSIAYLTSFASTSRLTGLENMTPFLIFTVTVLPSAEISGSPSARSGTGFAESCGAYVYRPRWIAFMIPIAYV